MHVFDNKIYHVPQVNRKWWRILATCSVFERRAPISGLPHTCLHWHGSQPVFCISYLPDRISHYICFKWWSGGVGNVLYIAAVNTTRNARIVWRETKWEGCLDLLLNTNVNQIGLYELETIPGLVIYTNTAVNRETPAEVKWSKLTGVVITLKI